MDPCLCGKCSTSVTAIKVNAGNKFFTVALHTDVLVFALPEDEQRSKLNSQKALHTVTMEKETALADLNSVERSLSDVFRRYENMKSTLEGFKKVRTHGTNSQLRFYDM